LPTTLGGALKALEASDELRAAAGDQLITTFAASRRAEIEIADGKSDEEIVAHYRWLL
jgi:glutamine synthetase